MLFKTLLFKKAPISVCSGKTLSYTMVYVLPASKAYALEICGDDEFFVGVRDGLSGDALFGIAWEDAIKTLTDFGVQIDDDGEYMSSDEASDLYADFVAFVETQILNASC